MKFIQQLPIKHWPKAMKNKRKKKLLAERETTTKKASLILSSFMLNENKMYKTQVIAIMRNY